MQTVQSRTRAEVGGTSKCVPPRQPPERYDARVDGVGVAELIICPRTGLVFITSRACIYRRSVRCTHPSLVLLKYRAGLGRSRQETEAVGDSRDVGAIQGKFVEATAQPDTTMSSSSLLRAVDLPSGEENNGVLHVTRPGKP